MEYTQYLFSGSVDTSSPLSTKRGDTGTDEVHVVGGRGSGKEGQRVGVNPPPLSLATLAGDKGPPENTCSPVPGILVASQIGPPASRGLDARGKHIRKRDSYGEHR